MSGLRALLRALFFGWLLALIELVRRFLAWLRRRPQRRVNEQGSRAHCVPVNHPAMRRPDPLIYDQYYLMGLGLAVTWDNPDIDIMLGTDVVAGCDLIANTDYEVRVRVWNASKTAFVVKMPVHLSYLSFGIGTESHPIATRKVSVGVLGSAGDPGFVSFPWRTPPEAGHYCLQALLDPADDANFGNNLGQKNTDVAVAHSPAEFSFELRNASRRHHRYRFGVDAYVIPRPSPCDDGPARGREARLARHHPSAHPVPTGWSIDVNPEQPSLAPGDALTVSVLATPPPGWTGTQPLNVTAYDDTDTAAGGVTLTVTRS